MDNLVEVNTDALEPKDYFRVLKENIKDSNAELLQNQLEVIAKHILLAKEVGQKTLLDKLSFTYDVIIREQLLFTHGYSKFVYQEDVKRFLDDIKTVKIIELDRYPRAIPLEHLEMVKKAKDLNLFDEFCIVFTDLSGNDYKTPEEKKFVERNRDPVLLGYFRHKKTGLKHDRFYFIADWEDEYCDLTFGKMIERMAESGIKNPEHTISTDHTYIQEVVRATLDTMDKKSSDLDIPSKPNKKKSTFFERVKEWHWKK